MEVDLFYVSDVRNFVFGYPTVDVSATDLCSITINRGRERGLPTYNEVRKAFGLAPKANFSDITADTVLANKLATLYGTIDNVDFFIGGLAEDHPGKHMGEAFTAVFANQMERARNGDRLYYKSGFSGFTDDEIAQLDSLRYSDIILRNTDIERIQCSMFVVSDQLDCVNPKYANKTQPNNTTTNNNSTNGAASSVTRTASLVNGQYTLAYTVTDTTISINASVTLSGAAGTGWIGFGFSKRNPPAMIGSDVVVGWVDASGNAQIDDYTAGAKQKCIGSAGVCKDTVVGGTSDITDTGVARDGNTLRMWFTRKLTTGDAKDVVVPHGNAVPVVVAFNPSDVPLDYHGPDHKVATFIDTTLPAGEEVVVVPCSAASAVFPSLFALAALVISML